MVHPHFRNPRLAISIGLTLFLIMVLGCGTTAQPAEAPTTAPRAAEQSAQAPVPTATAEPIKPPVVSAKPGIEYAPSFAQYWQPPTAVYGEPVKSGTLRVIYENPLEHGNVWGAATGAADRFRTPTMNLICAALLLLLPASAWGDPAQERYTPGAAGAGDPYFPLDGNGGYDVNHYLLDVSYDPATDVLTGEATLRARAEQNLSSFNLDFDGLTVRSITVDDRPATWTRSGAELTVTPERGLRAGRRFTTVVTYDGVPETIEDPQLGVMGFIHTNDGALVVGQPDVAATWFPVNDHPIDKAEYTFRVTVPSGLEAVANGRLDSRRTREGQITWTWRAEEPMASYLTTVAIGEFDVRSYREGGIRFWDALDPALSAPVALPRTGERFAISQTAANSSYKRLARTISVPPEGAQLSFWIARDTEPGFDFSFVEARPPGTQDWTTLPDLNGHTSADVGLSCPQWLGLHPFLTHYQTDNGDGTCTARGSTGAWWAASGASGGFEEWKVDLGAYSGGDVEVAITYASDDVFQMSGVFVDDVVVSNGPGTTSFEDDGDTLDGWAALEAPGGSPPNRNNWISGTAEDMPPPRGDMVKGSLARQGEIIDFLSDLFGRYPFSAAGAIVDDYDALAFALENQTRPVYSETFFAAPSSGDSVVVHELAHQWYGDSLAVESWQHIWLNEGFATYAEWLWSERDGLGTAQEIFDSHFGAIPPEDPLWTVTIGDPGPEKLFDFAVYLRGAMTLHQLRLTVGDDDFFRILRRWTSAQEDGNVTTGEFVRLAERISDQELDALFDEWLFTSEKPALPTAPAPSASALSSRDLRRAPPAVGSLTQRLGRGPGSERAGG
jgi:hypothetical protein